KAGICRLMPRSQVERDGTPVQRNEDSAFALCLLRGILQTPDMRHAVREEVRTVIARSGPFPLTVHPVDRRKEKSFPARPFDGDPQEVSRQSRLLRYGLGHTLF